MVNRVDGADRTRTEKPATAARQDGRVRTLAEKIPSTGFAHSFGIVI